MRCLILSSHQLTTPAHRRPRGLAQVMRQAGHLVTVVAVAAQATRRSRLMIHERGAELLTPTGTLGASAHDLASRLWHLLVTHEFDVIYAFEPQLSTVLPALMAQRLWGTRVMFDFGAGWQGLRGVACASRHRQLVLPGLLTRWASARSGAFMASGVELLEDCREATAPRAVPALVPDVLDFRASAAPGEQLAGSSFSLGVCALDGALPDALRGPLDALVARHAGWRVEWLADAEAADEEALRRRARACTVLWCPTGQHGRAAHTAAEARTRLEACLLAGRPLAMPLEGEAARVLAAAAPDAIYPADTSRPLVPAETLSGLMANSERRTHVGEVQLQALRGHFGAESVGRRLDVLLRRVWGLPGGGLSGGSSPAIVARVGAPPSIE